MPTMTTTSSKFESIRQDKTTADFFFFVEKANAAKIAVLWLLLFFLFFSTQSVSPYSPLFNG